MAGSYRNSYYNKYASQVDYLRQYRANQSTAVAAIDTIQKILDEADPMQALIDLMSFSIKPDYMWGGDGETHAVEIGSSGYDLLNTGVDTRTSSAVLGEGYFSLIEAGSSDKLVDYNESNLNVGSNDFACLYVFSHMTAGLNRRMFGNYDSKGWYCDRNFSGNATFYINDGTTLNACTVNSALGAPEAHTFLLTRDVSAAVTDLYCAVGTAQATGTNQNAADPATPNFGLGDHMSGSPAHMEFGIMALWKNPASLPTDTHRANLHTALNF
jgi:hypothetical protein